MECAATGIQGEIAMVFCFKFGRLYRATFLEFAGRGKTTLFFTFSKTKCFTPFSKLFGKAFSTSIVIIVICLFVFLHLYVTAFGIAASCSVLARGVK